MRFRVQFLDASTNIIQELTVDARNAVTVLERISGIDWPPRAVTMRVLDPDAMPVHFEAKGEKSYGIGKKCHDEPIWSQFMMKLVSCLAALLALTAAVDFGHAQAVGDPKEGLVLAQQVCSRCHATVAEQVRSANSQAPRFPDLAATPGMTRTALLVALTTPHAGMPLFTLTGEQRDDIIAYILSLR